MTRRSDTATLKQVTKKLDRILRKRTGGAVNFRGIHFQVLYSCYALLDGFRDDARAESVTLEGIEDIDLHSPHSLTVGTESIQLKSSENKMDAGAFWTMGVLQNFAEVYTVGSPHRFRLVYNMRIAKGNLSDLINRRVGQAPPTYWIEKLNAFDPGIDPVGFFDTISFEFQSTADLHTKILALLFRDWNVNKGTEMQFLSTLFHHIVIWSRDRATVTRTDIRKLFQEVTDSYSKTPTNKAIEHNWITAVYFRENGNAAQDYFDGKAARPAHIAAGLPVRRKGWEKQVRDAIDGNDVTLIRSSSGQGKSTLAWQVCYDLATEYSPYQLHTCRDSIEVNSIVEFLESRTAIGEMPLVIIDGLDHALNAWADVVQRTADQTVKYLITARQEDWFRYGADISRITLAQVEIVLSMTEARDIFEQFKRRGKIHSDITQWQPVWEQVHTKGLLIEYTFLLTRGEMIHERLSTQLKTLNTSASSAAKVEILRLVSLADCLNIKLKTSTLLDYIKVSIGFDQDRGLILDELEKEYFLNFDDKYIEGLHPVRSEHLKNLLHRNLPIAESLINLLRIVDEEYKIDFFTNAPLLLSEENKAGFYSTLAEQLAEAPISDMVAALDGIMHGEPQRYWLENRAVFDEAYNTGGIELFQMVTVPFTELDTLDELSGILKEKGSGFRSLADLKKKLPRYSFENSDVVLFAGSLGEYLKKRTTAVLSFQGLGFLIEWFNELKVPLRFPMLRNEIRVDELVNMELEDAREWMLFFRLNDPTAFRKFIDTNRDTIIAYLKVATDSLTVTEEGNDISIRYLLFDSEADRANEFSVFRAEIFHAFLPVYEHYCTEAILLPFPSEELVSIVKLNSIKRLSPETIGNTFDVHLNKIWLSVTKRNYQETSAYQWQKSILDTRKIIIEWAKGIVRFTDAMLEGNQKKNDASARIVDKMRGQLLGAIAAQKNYPAFGRKPVDSKDTPLEEKAVKSWLTDVSTFNSQMLNIFVPNVEQDRRLARINLKKMYLGLDGMQQAFRTVENKTVAYLDSEAVCKDENEWMERLYTTILYYLSKIPLDNPKKAVRVARTAVSEWWAAEKDRTLNSLLKTLREIEDIWGYEFVLPDSLDETETLTFATFGIRDFDFSDQQALEHLSTDLAILSDLPIDFYSILTVKDGIALGGARFKREYFETVDRLIQGEENVTLDGLSPLPVAADEKAVSTLPDIGLLELSAAALEQQDQVRIILDLWKLSEHRNRLNKASEIEQKWLERTESDLTSGIRKLLATLKTPSNGFADFVKTGLENDHIYSAQDIVDQLFALGRNQQPA